MSIQYTADQLQRKFQGAPGTSGFARIADVLREEGRHEEALALLDEGLRNKPGHLTGRLILAKCHLDMGRLEAAREQFEAVLRQDPRCLSAMHHLARIMVKLQWPEAAAAYYRSILELEPWDAEALERYREIDPRGEGAPTGASGFVPAETASLAAAAPVAPVNGPGETLDLVSEPPVVEEFDLNKVADFLPVESNPSELAGALQDAAFGDTLTASSAESRAIPAADDLAEPKPLDVLSETAPGFEGQATLPVEADFRAGEAPRGLEAPAPISGDDVGDRLDSLFGADDQPMAKAPAPVADAESESGPRSADFDPRSADFADATLQLKAMRQEPASLSGGADSLPTAPADWPGEAVPSPLETSVFNGRELVAPEDRVSGEDIEQRLDDLFSLNEETRSRPAQPALVSEATASEAVSDVSGLAEPAAETEPATENTGFPPMGAAVVAPEAAEPATEPPAKAFDFDADSDIGDLPFTATPKAVLEPFEPASLDTILAPEAGLAAALSPDEVVTGQDVADKLEALFGNEPAPKSAPPASREETPVELPDSGSASWATARPTDEGLSSGEAQGAGTAEAPTLPEPTAAASGISPSDTWVESLEAPPPSTDLMSTESMLPRGISELGRSGREAAPAITGDDIEDRLDSLFNIGDDALPAAAPASAPASEIPAAEGLEAFSAPAFPPPESPSAPFSEGDSDRTVLMPAVKETAGDWGALQAEEPPAPPVVEPAAPEAPASPVMGGGDTLFMRNEDVFAPEETASVPGTDTVGMEMVDGADIAERLDQIFAPGEVDPRSADLPASVAKAVAEAAIARGEAASEVPPELPDPEATLPLVEGPDTGTELSLETGEMPLDEAALFAEDPEAALAPPEPVEGSDLRSADSSAGPMVSGEDVKSRLSELFEEPDAGNEEPSLAAPALEAGAADEPSLEVFPDPAGWSAGAAAGEAPEAVEEMPASGKPNRPAAQQVPPAAEEASAGMPPVAQSPERPSPSLAPLMDEEEGSPEEEENAPQSAAGANVATVTLAEIYFQQGLREQALQIYRQLLEREPGNESVRKRIQEIEASKPEAGPGAGADPRRPRPGLKVPKRKK